MAELNQAFELILGLILKFLLGNFGDGRVSGIISVMISAEPSSPVHQCGWTWFLPRAHMMVVWGLTCAQAGESV
jgi:hypothetical protein